jgi:hypothetical protein
VTGRVPSKAERFVGRDHELQEIQAVCTAATTHARGSLVVVSGEAGIGKTRFCEEATNVARRAGLEVVTARCWVDGGAPPLWPWQPILGELCGSDAGDLLASDAGVATVEADRFARFATVVDQLARTCAERPVWLVIDDMHKADAGTLLLARFVARSLPRLSLVLVISCRSGEPPGDSTEARLLDEIESEARPIALGHFDLAETSAFLASHGLQDLEPGLVLAMHRVTGGNPLFLRRIVALGVPDPQGRLPAGLHTAIEQALSRSSSDTQRLLRASAVLGLVPSVTEAATVADTEPAAMLDAVAEAVDAGLVTMEEPDRFAFTHELVRSALENALAANERLNAHARAVWVLASDGPAVSTARLARRAHHALAAAPRSAGDARLAVSACQAAARSMIDSLAYEQADGLLSAAVRLYEHSNLGTPSGLLLLSWAQAALMCGHLAEARVRFDRAAAVAEHEGDPEIFAEAALGLGGHWVNEHREPVVRMRVLGLQRAALARLPERQSPLRCRLVARLAAEGVYDGRPVEPVYEALDAARGCGDRGALAEALHLSHHALLAPEHAHVRLDLAEELLRVASEAGYGVLGLMGLCWRAVDLLHLGDGRAIRALEDLRVRADALACQSIVYIVDVVDVMLLIRAGRLDEAEIEAKRCYERGSAVGEADTLPYLSAHTLAIRWIQGRDDELLDAAEEVAASPTVAYGDFTFRAIAAAIAARAEHHERARSTLNDLTTGGLAALPGSSTWLVGMLAIVEAAAVLGDEAVARDAYHLLLPFADLPIVASLGVVCLGSTERALGLAATTFGELDRAVQHFEQAVSANRRLGNLPLAAITRAELATTLGRRGRAEDRVKAADLLETAIAHADGMGMSKRIAGWRAELSALRSYAAPETGRARRRSDRQNPAASTRRGVIRREGRGWLVGLDDRRVFTADLVGMSYLNELLTHPGRHIPALTLAVGDTLAGGGPARHELLDKQARVTYAARARELTDDLAEAEANHDIIRAEQLRTELDALVDHLEAATGLNGRPRNFTDQAERARTAVRKAIKRAIDEIDASDPWIADLLRSSVSTGSTCSYSADPRTAVVWSTHELDAVAGTD